MIKKDQDSALEKHRKYFEVVGLSIHALAAAALVYHFVDWLF